MGSEAHSHTFTESAAVMSYGGMKKLLDYFASPSLNLATLACREFNAALSEHRYRGGWNGCPDYDKSAYEAFEKWIKVGVKKGITENQISTLGSNCLWTLADSLVAHIYHEGEKRLGGKIRGGDDSWHQLVAGLEMTFYSADHSKRVKVYSGKCRSDLRNNSTYDDKYIEILVENKVYSLRAVDHKGQDSAMRSVNGLSLKDSGLKKANKGLSEALLFISDAIQSERVEFEVNLFDRHLSPEALKNLLSWMSKVSN